MKLKEEIEGKLLRNKVGALCLRRRRRRLRRAGGIKGQKLTKEKVLEYMNSIEGKSALNQEKIIALFDNYAYSINYTKNIKTVDDVLTFAKENNSWFSLIFK